MWMIGAWIAVAATDADARALAVLELQKGAGSAEHEGLGKGLAGMIVADLTGLPGLELVERDRIDALKGELALGAAGFLDPSTAAQAGRAVGAEVWLVGSYNVVGQDIAIDARLVDANTQKILEGATAKGPLADWVGVEKRLVEEVAADLGLAFDSRAKREFYARVPTESFDAFAAYSLGLSEQQKGEFDRAEAAFREALAKDPEFSDALNSISALRDLVDRARAADAAEAAGARTAMIAKVLANTPDPRAHTGPWSPTDLVELPARWAVLLERGDACQRHAEMSAVLEAFDWQPQKALQGFAHIGDFRTQSERAAAAAGFVPWDSDRLHPDREVQAAVGRREVPLFESTAAFLYGDLRTASDRGAALAGSLLACRGGSEAAAALRGWERALAARQLLDAPATNVLTHREMLVVARAWFEADTGTVSAASREGLDALITAAPDAERDAVIRMVESIQNHAVAEERWRLASLGMPVSTVRARLEAMAAGAAPFRSTPPWCAAESDRYWRGEAARLLEMWKKDEAEAKRPELPVAFSATIVRSAADMGCFDGVTARVSTWAETKAFVRAAAARTHPNAATDTSCGPRVTGVLQSLGVADDVPVPLQGNLAQGALRNAYALVQARCLVDGR